MRGRETRVQTCKQILITILLFWMEATQLPTQATQDDKSQPVRRQKHQMKALLLKNLRLQSRQPCTNVCQVLTPIICLFFTILIRNAAIDNIPNQNNTIYASLPLISSKLNDFFLADQMDEIVRREPGQWLLYECEDPADRYYIGHRINFTAWGLLGHIPTTANIGLMVNNSLEGPEAIGSYGIPPLLVQSRSSVVQQLFDRFQFLNNDTLFALRETSSAYHLPDGAVSFKKVNHSRLQATVRVKDVREFLFYRPTGISEIRMRADVENGTRFNSFFIIPEGLLTVMDMLTKAFIRLETGRTLTAGYTYMPFGSEGAGLVEILINAIATIIFPLALSLLLPVFLYLVVLQKEEKLIQMMRMNGMGILNYWGINCLYNLLISLATNLVFYLYGWFFLDISFFRQTSPLLLAVVMLGWILAQIGLSVFLQVFLSSSRAANIIGYLVAIWTNLVGATLSVAMFQFPVQQPLAISLWPTFAFTRLFYLLFTYCSMDQCLQTLDALTPEMTTCIAVLYTSALLFALLGMYLFQVVPQEFGVSKPLLFPLHWLLDCLGRGRRRAVHQVVEGREGKNDATVEEEVQEIAQIEDFGQYALVVEDLSKRYDSGKLAVDRLSLKVEDRTIFGLLGPNGAGKTTLLSMITGIFGPSHGQAYVAGHSIRDSIDQVHLQMGVCPQFDILWPTLTVEEHLYFYARLRGVPASLQDQKVTATLQEVNLQDWRKAKARELSGGMKRRLSIGISLVGDPRIVFMDEPTTGLDPENRRHLWEVLAACRSKRAVLLTTHLMEEAESLCDRVGIITSGTLRTLGDQFRLKQLYGKGYFVSVSVEMNKPSSRNESLLSDYQPSLNEEYLESSASIRVRAESMLTEQLDGHQDYLRHQLEGQNRIKERLLEVFRPASVAKQIGGLIKICVAESRVSVILEELRRLSEQEEHVAFQWAISDSTLEDVFLEVVLRFQESSQPSLLDSLDPEIGFD